MARMRCFVAIELPEAVRTGLMDFVRRAGAPRDGLRWCVANQLHVTLRFLGELSPAAVERAAVIVREVSAACRPFEIEVRGLGCFPPHGPPRVLWCGVDDRGEGCAGWVRSAEPRWREVGVPEEKRFSAHVTLARVRAPPGSDRALEIVRAAGPPAPAQVRVASVTLFESRLERTGAVYRPIVTAPLRG